MGMLHRSATGFSAALSKSSEDSPLVSDRTADSESVADCPEVYEVKIRKTKAATKLKTVWASSGDPLVRKCIQNWPLSVNSAGSWVL